MLYDTYVYISKSHPYGRYSVDSTHPLISFIILTGRKRKQGPLSRIIDLQGTRIWGV